MTPFCDDVPNPEDDRDHAVLVTRLAGLAGVPVRDEVARRHLEAIGRQATRRRRGRRVTVAAITASGVLMASTSLAAAGVLPAPAQQAAHETLAHLGIEVPNEAHRREPAGPADGRRRVTDDPAAAGSARPGRAAPVADVAPSRPEPATAGTRGSGATRSGPSSAAGPRATPTPTTSTSLRAPTRRLPAGSSADGPVAARPSPPTSGSTGSAVDPPSRPDADPTRPVRPRVTPSSPDAGGRPPTSPPTSPDPSTSDGATPARTSSTNPSSPSPRSVAARPSERSAGSPSWTGDR